MFTLKTGVVCLLAAIMAATVYAYSHRLDLYALYGAAIGADCIDPCKDDNYLNFIECDDLNGVVGECVVTRCMINKFAYATCTPRGGSSAAQCDYWNDPDAPRRWITVKIMDCNDKGEKTFPYGDCADGGGYGSVWTPCLTDACDGEIYDGIENKVEAKNKTKCGKKPVPKPE